MERLTSKASSLDDAVARTAFISWWWVWYENANGLAEIAVNGGRADTMLGPAIGTPVEIA